MQRLPQAQPDAPPIQDMPELIMYRPLRNEIEPLAPNPLETATLDDIYNESIAWMKSLEFERDAPRN